MRYLFVFSLLPLLTACPEDDILGLVGSLDNLATKDGDVYTLNDDVFTPPNKPPSPNKSVNIIVS